MIRSMLDSFAQLAPSHGEIVSQAAAAAQTTMLARTSSNSTADATWTVAAGRALRTCNVAEQQLFTILAMVSETQKSRSGGERFRVCLIPSSSRVGGVLISRLSSETVQASVHDRGDGTYTVLYKVDAPGQYQLEVRLMPRGTPPGGATGGGDDGGGDGGGGGGAPGTHIQGSPFVLEVAAAGGHFDSRSSGRRHSVPLPYFQSSVLRTTSALGKQLHSAQVQGFDDANWTPAAKSVVQRAFAQWSEFESPAAPTEFKVGAIFDILEENILRRSRRFFRYHSVPCNVLRDADGPVHFLDLRRRNKLVIALQLLDARLVPSRCSNVFSGKPFTVSRYPQELTLRRQMWHAAMDGGRAHALESVYCTYGANLQQLIVSADLNLQHKLESSMETPGDSLLLIPLSAEVVVDGFCTVFCLRSLLAVKIVNHRRVAVDSALRHLLRSAKAETRTAMPRAAYVVSTDEVPELCDWRGTLSIRLRHVQLQGLEMDRDAHEVLIELRVVRPHIGRQIVLDPKAGPPTTVRCKHGERVDVERAELSVVDFMHDELLLRMLRCARPS